jgi:serine/threonine protein kinase
MKEKALPWLIGLVERIYRLSLYLYPAKHRQEYGELMAQVFGDMCRDALAAGGSLAVLGVFVRTMADLIRTAVHEHIDPDGGYLMSDLPSKIGNYEVQAEVGRGSLGTIYRAIDPKNQREVAIKTINTDLSSQHRQAMIESMRKGAKLSQTLEHPGLVPVLEYVEKGDDAFAVMPFINGATLLETLDANEGPLPVTDVLDGALKTCEVLIYLHKQPQPLVFRDIKPGNIMVERESGRVYLTDLGITEIVSLVEDSLPKIGTEGYSPPEQYKGASDARSDVYALGASLHHLLTGRDPRQQPPFSFGEAPVRDLNPAIPEALAAIVEKATAYQADERYQSIEEMRDALLGVKETA